MIKHHFSLFEMVNVESLKVKYNLNNNMAKTPLIVPKYDIPMIVFKNTEWFIHNADAMKWIDVDMTLKIHIMIYIILIVGWIHSDLKWFIDLIVMVIIIKNDNDEGKIPINEIVLDWQADILLLQKSLNSYFWHIFMSCCNVDSK